MTCPSTEIDKIGVELHEGAQEYARKAACLARDPYFKEAIVKASVSGFVWALYNAFDDEFARSALDHELKVQSAAIERALTSKDENTH
jgi:hypothetical protein